MQRRTMLGVSGATVASVLSGCAGSNGTDDGNGGNGTGLDVEPQEYTRWLPAFEDDPVNEITAYDVTTILTSEFLEEMFFRNYDENAIELESLDYLLVAAGVEWSAVVRLGSFDTSDVRAELERQTDGGAVEDGDAEAGYRRFTAGDAVYGVRDGVSIEVEKADHLERFIDSRHGDGQRLIDADSTVETIVDAVDFDPYHVNIDRNRLGMHASEVNGIGTALGGDAEETSFLEVAVYSSTVYTQRYQDAVVDRLFSDWERYGASVNASADGDVLTARGTIETEEMYSD